MDSTIQDLFFTKMQGIGNDFIIIENLKKTLSISDASKLAKKMCQLHFAVGSDGLILVEEGKQTQYFMRMFNPDGTQSGACGNGTRCFAKYLLNKDLITTNRPIQIETSSNILDVNFVENGMVSVNMGSAYWTRQEVGLHGEPLSNFIEEKLFIADKEFLASAVSMGNPHIVIFVENVGEVLLEQWGSALENHVLFIDRANVHFVQIIDQDTILQRTWERGAGVTMACGSGACACVAIAYKTGRTKRKVKVELPGGNLQIFYREDGQLIMTGPAETVFEGTWKLF